MMISPHQISYLPYWKDGTTVGNLANSTNWQELSGMTYPTVVANRGYLWTVSDSPANQLAAVNITNAANAGVWTLSGVSISSPSDWEDMTSAKVNGVSYLYVADFGDNPNTRTTFNIHRVIEPTVTGSNGTVSAGDIHTIVCQYPGGGSAPTHKDAECIMADPDTGDLYMITKRESIPGVYYLAHAATYTGTQTMTYLGKMYDIPDITTQPLGATACNVVGGCISPNGKEIMVKNYNDVYYFARPDKSVSIYTALTQTGVLVNAYVGGGTTTYKKSHPSAEPQGESICFDYDGVHWYTCSEYLTSEGSSATDHPLFKYERVSAVPTSISFQDGVLPTAGYAGTLDTYIWDTNPTTNNGTAVSMVADRAGASEPDQRKCLLSFDISSIPSTAKVVSARLDLYINTEGQGFKLYPMLVTWGESSTYNSLTGGIDNDGTDAAVAPDCAIYLNTDTYVGSIRCNIKLATVQSWINGSLPNYGWLIENTDTGGDGLQFDTRQGATASRHPKLTIQYV